MKKKKHNIIKKVIEHADGRRTNSAQVSLTGVAP